MQGQGGEHDEGHNRVEDRWKARVRAGNGMSGQGRATYGRARHGRSRGRSTFSEGQGRVVAGAWA